MASTAHLKKDNHTAKSFAQQKALLSIAQQKGDCT
jgi:hypothetical protein